MGIKLKNIKKEFQNVVVFKNLNLEIEYNKITCIMGSSGVGKTTLIHMLMGLLKPDEGILRGLDKKKITAVFQENRLCESFDAITNVKIACKEKISEEEVKNEFYNVGLTDYENKPVSELSGGMKRRVAIIRAVLPLSDIIIMDEPFKGLDYQLKIKVVEYVKQKTKGKTVIIVTHDNDVAQKLSSDVINL